MSLNVQTINYADFNNICRTCLIDCESKAIRQENVIIEILHNLTGVRFETNDELPKQICLNCFEKINEIHAFSSQCKQSHFNLIKCLNNHKNKRLAEEKKQDIEFVPVNNMEIKQEKTTDDCDSEINELNINCFQDNLLLPITDIDSNDSEIEMTETPPREPETITEAETYNSIPLKSKKKYEGQYNLFMDWRLKNRASSFSDSILLSYFQNLSRTRKPSSLWSIYSMLRMMLKVQHNVDISKYHKLCTFLKRVSSGYKPKKSLNLTPEQIQEFLTQAPDELYLFIKVALIFGMMGGCHREVIMKIEQRQVDDLQTALLVHIPDEKEPTNERQFVIGGSLYKICRKYMDLRPENVETNRFFLNYQRGKCTKQPVGINKCGGLASQAAAFLKLPDAKSYTGHCLRRSDGTTVLMDTDLY